MQRVLIFIIPTILAIFSSILIFQVGKKAVQIEAYQTSNYLYNVTYDQLTPNTQKQVMCLAENIFHEAAQEPKSGQVAVAFVTLNRVKNKQFPNDICSVVKQRKVRDICQFSWYCQGKKSFKRLTKDHVDVYNKTIKLAVHVYANYDKLNDPSNGALFYHADYVRPHWRKGMNKVAMIGKHIFYVKKDI